MEMNARGSFAAVTAWRMRTARALVAAALAVAFTVVAATALPAAALADDAAETQGAVSSITGLEDVGAQWKNFRNSDSNMAITSIDLPTTSSDANVKWATRLGDWDMYNQPNVPIIVDDCLISCSRSTLYKMDLQTGKRVATGAMSDSTNWGYTPMAYAEGMIFVPIKSGVQAFDAKTLESLWVYRSGSGNQATSPIAYSDGCIYMGWWKSETGTAEFACIDIRDTDVSATDETPRVKWSKSVAGGFYWAGAVVVGDNVIVGSDNGTNDNSGTAHVYSFDKDTGDVVSEIALPDMGDVRSSMAYDKGSGCVFFTTRSGYACKLDVDASTGKLSNLKSADLAGNTTASLESTSTPVVYDGRVFVGVNGKVAGAASSDGGGFVMLDASTLEVLDTVSLPGPCKSSALLSTAHESEGWLYLCVTCNKSPGGIQTIKVPVSGSASQEMQASTIYDAEGYEQYCICSLICADDGTLYYKNDSGNLLAIGEPQPAKAIEWERISGEDRYETAAKIVSKGFESTGGTVIVTTGQSFPDALCASGLAGALDEDGSGVPVVLTSTNELSGGAAIQLARLKPSTVIVIGGESAVSSDAESQIERLLNIEVERIPGSDRYDTCNNVYKYGSEHGHWSSTAIIATGKNFPDSLSVSPYAYASKSPILLAGGYSNDLSTDTSAIVKGSTSASSANFDRVLIVGGTAVVSRNVEAMSQIGAGKMVQRLSGETRDDTSIQIARWATGWMDSAAFQPSELLNYDNMAIATSANYPDALAGAAFCGKNKSVVALMSNSTDGAAKLASGVMTPNKASISNVCVLGGTSAIGEDVLSSLKSQL